MRQRCWGTGDRGDRRSTPQLEARRQRRINSAAISRWTDGEGGREDKVEKRHSGVGEDPKDANAVQKVEDDCNAGCDYAVEEACVDMRRDAIQDDPAMEIGRG